MNNSFTVNDFVRSAAQSSIRTNSTASSNVEIKYSNGHPNNIQRRITRSMTHDLQRRSRRHQNRPRNHVLQLTEASRQQEANSATLEYLAEVQLVGLLNNHNPERDTGSRNLETNTTPPISIVFRNKDDCDLVDCAICMEINVKYATIYPCNHNTICVHCIKRLPTWNCPFCRIAIASYTIKI